MWFREFWPYRTTSFFLLSKFANISNLRTGKISENSANFYKCGKFWEFYKKNPSDMKKSTTSPNPLAALPYVSCIHRIITNEDKYLKKNHLEWGQKISLEWKNVRPQSVIPSLFVACAKARHGYSLHLRHPSTQNPIGLKPIIESHSDFHARMHGEKNQFTQFNGWQNVLIPTHTHMINAPQCSSSRQPLNILTLLI